MKTRRNAFTMVELMIVIVIVAILAAVATPMLRGRMEKAKWSEAMAGCSSIATAVRSWAAENSNNTSTVSVTGVDPTKFDFTTDDLNGKYFNLSDYKINASYNPTSGVLSYTITATGSGSGGAPSGTLTLKKDASNDNTFTLTSNGNTTNF